MIRPRKHLTPALLGPPATLILEVWDNSMETSDTDIEEITIKSNVRFENRLKMLEKCPKEYTN